MARSCFFAQLFLDPTPLRITNFSFPYLCVEMVIKTLKLLSLSVPQQ